MVESGKSLPPSGQEKCNAPSYKKLLLRDVVTRAVDKLGLDCDCKPMDNQVQSKLDYLFFTSCTPSQPVGLFPYFKTSTTSSPFQCELPTLPLISPRYLKWRNTVMGQCQSSKRLIATYRMPNSAPSWKAKPMLPSKPCRITSAGQAAAMLHSMGVLQAYQAELLKELDEGEGLTPEAVKELRRATDLALRATKHKARAVGRAVAGFVSVEHHLWLTITDIKEKDKKLFDAPISKDGLFGDSVTTVVEKFRAASI